MAEVAHFQWHHSVQRLIDTLDNADVHLTQGRRGATAALHLHCPTLVLSLRRLRSTRSEALGVASRMGAYRTILTHLSQRYSRLPGLLPPQPNTTHQ